MHKKLEHDIPLGMKRDYDTCANLLFEYPNQLLYLCFPDVRFISSASTKPIVCI